MWSGHADRLAATDQRADRGSDGGRVAFRARFGAGDIGPAQGDKFKGVNVNILTFNGPQVAEPLQRRAPDWERLTGGHVNVVAVGFQTIYDKALLDASTGTNSFDAYVFDPQWMGDFTGPGYLLDLTGSRPERSAAPVERRRPVLQGLQRDLQRQGLHDPARRRLPHGLLPE